jgi:hypothetical protein
MVWKKEGDNYIFATNAEESEKRPISAGAVRGAFLSAIRIAPIDGVDGTVRLESVIHPDFGGNFNMLIRLAMKRNLQAAVTVPAEFFLQLRGMDEYSRADGRALGYRRELAPTSSERGSGGGSSSSSSRSAFFFLLA